MNICFLHFELFGVHFSENYLQSGDGKIGALQPITIPLLALTNKMYHEKNDHWIFYQTLLSHLGRKSTWI